MIVFEVFDLWRDEQENWGQDTPGLVLFSTREGAQQLADDGNAVALKDHNERVEMYRLRYERDRAQWEEGTNPEWKRLFPWKGKPVTLEPFESRWIVIERTVL